MSSERRRFPRSVAVAAMALGIAAGSYGVASAASGSGGSSSGSGGGSTTATTATPSGAPWGHQRSDETVLNGDTATKVRDAALAKVPGGTIVRVETDADGEAAYEAHMTDANGNPVTVYVNASFDVVGTESGHPGGHGRHSSSDASSSA